MELIGELESSYKIGFKPPFVGEIYDYAKKLNLQKGYAVKGAFDVHRSKYLIKPFQSIRNRTKRVINIKKAVQTGGSLVADLTVPYWIENDPGGILWLLQDDDFAKHYADSRAMPLVTSAKEIKELLRDIDRHNKTKTTIQFATMTLLIGGLNEGNVQSLSWQYVIIDEGWMAESNGLIRQAKDRATAFPYTSKILIIGQGGVKGDDSNIEWEESNKQEWGWCCPSCSKLQQYEWTIQRPDGSWAGVIWETNEFTRPGGKRIEQGGKRSYEGGKWNYQEVAKTARFVCVHCGHNVDDTPNNRRQMNDGGDYIVTNPSAQPDVDGFHWPAEANIDIKLGWLVQKYLKAKVQDEQFGNRLPLIEFHQKQRGADWDANQIIDIHRVAIEPYEINSEWPDERWRDMVVDCQREFSEFWVIIRAKAQDGESRQLFRGKLHSWGDIVRLQADWKIKDQHVFVDCGYEQTKVLAECVKHGHWGEIKGFKIWLCWNALKGMDHDTWTHIVPNPQNQKETITVRRVYSPKISGDPGIGKSQTGPKLYVPTYHWSNLHVKDTTRRRRDGKAGRFLCLPCEDRFAKEPESFTAQMNSERRELKKNKKPEWTQIGDRPNHFWDCENMQTAADYIRGTISDASLAPEQKEAV